MTDRTETTDTNQVTRLELIGPRGRELVVYGAANVTLSLQDDGRTLKVFYGASDSTISVSNGGGGRHGGPI